MKNYKDTSRILLFLAGVYLYFYANNYVFKTALADFYYKQSQIAFSKTDFENSHNFADKALRYNKKEPEYYVQRAKSGLGLIPASSNQAKLKNATYKDIKHAVSLNGNNLVVKRNVIGLYYFLSIQDFSRPPGKDNLDDFYFDNARRYYNDLINEYPNDVGLLGQIALYQNKLGINDDYTNTLTKIKELRPDLLEWYIKE